MNYKEIVPFQVYSNVFEVDGHEIEMALLLSTAKIPKRNDIIELMNLKLGSSNGSRLEKTVHNLLIPDQEDISDKKEGSYIMNYISAYLGEISGIYRSDAIFILRHMSVTNNEKTIKKDFSWYFNHSIMKQRIIMPIKRGLLPRRDEIINDLKPGRLNSNPYLFLSPEEVTVSTIEDINELFSICPFQNISIAELAYNDFEGIRNAMAIDILEGLNDYKIKKNMPIIMSQEISLSNPN
jgi:hypothetical protein